MKNILTFCFLLISIAVVAKQKPDPNFELYVLAGQSNMAGRGYITGDFKTETNDHVFMLTKDNTWVQAKHPVHFDKPAAGVGPGLAFGIVMATQNPKVRIGLIPTAVGGSPIEHWMPGAYDAATKTHPWDDAVERIKFAMQYGVIKGVIWHQGESNANQPEQIKAYLAQLQELIGRFRQLVGNDKLPFVAGQLGNYRPNFILFNEEILKLPAMVPYTAVVTTENLVHRGDTLHFDSPSAEELGRRYAAKMIQLQKRNK
jgi:hypothetical protein